MFTSTLALMTRTLREDVRTAWPAVLRLLLIAIVFWMLLITHDSIRYTAAPGLNFFTMISFLSNFFLVLAASSYFATPITEEKEEMSLGLLRMAGINPVAILLGKSIPRQITAVVLLSLQLPFTMLAITLGGVTMHQVLSAYLTLLAALLMWGNLGLLISVLSQHSSAASWRMVAIFLFLLLFPWIVNNAGLNWLTNSSSGFLYLLGKVLFAVTGWLADVSPFEQIGRIMSTGYSDPFFNYQVTSNLIGAVLFFLLAWGAFVFIPQEEKPVMPGRGLFSNPLPRLRFARIGRPWTNAIAWKDYHFLAGSRSWFLLKMLGYPLVTILAYHILVRSPNRPFRLEEFGETFLVLSFWGLLIEPIVYASRVFYDELKWKTLSTLLMIPRSLGEILYSKVAGCLLGLFPAAFWFFFGILLALESFGRELDRMIDEPGFWWMGANYCVFLHLIAFLSLHVKWGAVPLAFAVVFLFNGCCISTIAFSGPGGPDDGFLLLLALIEAGVCLGLHVAIAEGLRNHSQR